MAEKNFRKKLYPDYKKKKPKKPKIHPDDIAPEVGHKEKVEGTQAVQDADMKEGKYLDTGKLDKSGKPLMISSEMEKSYERNKGNPEFNREMEAYGKAQKKGNLTDEDRIRILNRNKQLLQIGQSVVQTGRDALSIGNGLWQTYRALRSLK